MQSLQSMDRAQMCLMLSGAVLLASLYCLYKSKKSEKFQMIPGTNSFSGVSRTNPLYYG